MRPIRLVLVDDHEILLHSLQSWLKDKEDIHVVGVARTAEDAIPLARELKPDVILFDVDMPGRSSFDVASMVRGVNPTIRLAFLSAYPSDLYIERAIDAGAVGYIFKGESPDILVEGIRRIAAGERYFSPRVRERIVVDASGVRPVAGAERTRLSLLSDRELEVLRLVAAGLTSKEIAATLHLSPKTVDNHTQRIMEKLNIHGRAELVRFAIREGCVQP